jgi:hypothetical protein
VSATQIFTCWWSPADLRIQGKAQAQASGCWTASSRSSGRLRQGARAERPTDERHHGSVNRLHMQLASRSRRMLNQVA